MVGKLERLVGAHEARQKGEYWHTDAALVRYPEVGQLQQSGRCIFLVGGEEQGVVEGSGDVGADDESRGDTSETLWQTGGVSRIGNRQVGIQMTVNWGRSGVKRTSTHLMFRWLGLALILFGVRFASKNEARKQKERERKNKHCWRKYNGI